MPTSFQILPELRRVQEVLWGKVSIDELRALATQIWEHPAYDCRFQALIDLSNATLTVQPAEVREYCQWLNQSPVTLVGRTALVASRPVETALGLMFQNGLRSHREVAVFSTVAAAEAFLAEDVILPPVNRPNPV